MKHATNRTFGARSVVRLAFAVLTSTLFAIVPAFAQNYSSDARLIGMGAIGGNDSDASRLVGTTREYRSIGIPLGLFQVFENFNVFRPGHEDFNPLHAMELAASPLHYTFNRDESGPGNELVKDLIKSEFSRNLSDYKGFTPDSQIDAAGLLSPNWGMTFKVRKTGDSGYQGFYVGAGPYVSVGTSVSIDQDLINFFADPSAPSPANTQYQIGDITGIQGAMAITGGYRARLPVSLARLSAGSSDRNGVFVAVNFNYLHGFHYENADLDVLIETDNTGQLTLTPSSRPIVVDRIWSENGKGFSVDVSTQLVTDRWNAGFAVEGIGNRIDWEDLDAERWELTALTTGVDFISSPLAAPAGPLRVTLPVRYSTNAGVRIAGLATGMEYRHGLQKNEFHAGAEYSLLLLEFRGGLRYSRPKWNPTAGLGLNLGKRIGIDVAGFGTSTNAERNRKVAMALSLRINKAE
jgi:hypothetical protein